MSRTVHASSSGWPEDERDQALGGRELRHLRVVSELVQRRRAVGSAIEQSSGREDASERAEEQGRREREGGELCRIGGRIDPTLPRDDGPR